MFCKKSALGRLKWPLIAWVMAIGGSISLTAFAAPARIALRNASPELAGLASCLVDRLGSKGEPVKVDGLPDGIEFRMQLHATSHALTIEALLKPDVASLITALNHDGDPEAQPEAAQRFIHLLRIPVGIRAWHWRQTGQAAICREAAGWMDGLRIHPILFDRLEGPREAGTADPK